MSNVFYRRLSGLSVLLIAIVVLLLARLGSFQFQLDTATYLQNLASKTYHTARELVPIRGRIFDRNGNLLAGNEMYYDVGISPNLVFDAQKTSAQLVKLLSLDPATRLRTPGGPVEVVRLVPENQDLPTLVALAGQARPEVSARAA